MYDNVAYQISASKVKNCGVGVILCDHVYSIALAGFFYCICLVDPSDWLGGSSGTVGWVTGLIGSWVRWAKCFR